MTARSVRYGVAVVRTADDGTLSVTVAAAFKDYLRAVSLAERTQVAAEKLADAEYETHIVRLVPPTIKGLLT